MNRFLRIVVSLTFVFSGLTVFSQTHVVISEVYGGGGNGGSTYKNDFIELYNPTSSPVSLNGWSVQYLSATGTGTWGSPNAPTTLSGTISPGGYYLIQEAPGAGGTTNLPTPDVTGNLVLSATAGKVALVNSTTALTGCTASVTIVDFFSYGGANCSEGSPTAALTNSTSAERKLSCNDSDNNLNDFYIAVLPNPQNSSSTFSSARFADNYPKTQNVGASGFDILTKLDNYGMTYFVVLPTGSTAPTSTQVRAGQDGSGNALSAPFKGDFIAQILAPATALTSATEYAVTVNGLSSLTAYDVYLVNERCILSASKGPVTVTTLVPVDNTPPINTSGYPKVQNVTGTGLQVATNLDGSGTTYFVVLPSGAPAPIPAQVKAGQDGSGTALAANLFGSMALANSATEYTTAITGLTQNSNYSVYFVSEDAVANHNLQTSVIQVDVSTPVEYDENFDTCNGTVSSFTRISVTGVQIWDCNSFGKNGTNGIQINGGFSGGSNPNEDWLISPLLNLSTTSIITFNNRKDFFGDDITFKISTNYDGVSAPSTAAWTDLTFTKSTNAGSTGVFVSSGPVDLSIYGNQSIYVAFVYTSGSTANTGARWAIDDFAITNATPAYLVASTATLGNFGYVQSPGASVAKSFDITGVGLSSDVMITAPTGYEVSRDGTNYSSTFNFTSTEAATTQVVYVRFKPAASVGALTENVIVVNGNKTINVSVSGTEGIDPRSLTFDVVCYNMEFFGTDVKDGPNGTEFGPTNDALQITNVGTVLKTMGADIYGVEEISDDPAFNQLVAGLPGYAGILAPKWSYSWQAPDQYFPPQKVGFIYNTSTVHIVSSRVMFSAMYDQITARDGTSTLLPGYPTTESSFWSSGRLPFMVTIDATINGVKKRIRMIDIHSKSGSAAADYARRQYDVQVLHDSLNAHYPNDNIILVGDYNDNVEGSIYTGHVSSYKTFVDDVNNYHMLTDALALAGAYSFPSSSSFLDHMIISNELTSAFVANSIAIEDPRNYIVNYSTTTSDHLPVTASFNIVAIPQTITFGSIADKTIGDPAFALTATSSSTLNVSYSTTSDKVTIAVSQVTLVKAGRVTITAVQAGNDNYGAAPSVDQSFCIKPAKPTITISNTNTVSPTLTSSATTGNQWYLNGNAINGATNATLNVTGVGTYKVQVKVDDCLSAFSSDTPIIITGDLATAMSGIVVYPNPARDYIEVRGIVNDVVSSQVTDMMGRTSTIILEKNGDAHRALIENFSTGVYVLRIQDGSSVHQAKFIKK